MLSYSFYESDTRIMQYAAALVDRGDSVDVICLGRPGEPDRTVLNGVNVVRVQTRKVNEKGPFSYLYRIARFIFVSSMVLTHRHLSNRYDLIHVHSVPDFLVFAAIVPKLTGTPLILDIHDILPEFCASKFKLSHDSLLFRFMLFAERRSARFADHVIVANDLWRDRVALRSAKPQNCSSIGNYPDPEMFRLRPRSNVSEKFTIIFPGSLNWHQGVDVAINAFARISAQLPETEFRIYGEGPEKPALIALTQNLHMQDKVFFHEFVPTEEIAEIMANCDLAIVPKRASSSFGTEAASTKIREFMSLGVPVLVSRTKVDTYYHDESTVTFFESENEADLAACILKMRNDASLRQRQVQNALKSMEADNWDVKKNEYLGLVDSLQAKKLASWTAEVQKDRAIARSGHSGTAGQPKIWIDLDNSPHVPFFVPIIEDLEKLGYSILLTARDSAQVFDLLDFYHLDSKRIGSGSGKWKPLKMISIVVRAMRMIPLILRERPVMALSHGSRTQVVVSLFLRIPSVMITDYEHANNSLARYALSWAIVPEVISEASMGMAKDRVIKYPGIKEDVYVQSFEPDPKIRAQLGLKSDDLVITVRPPANQAHYHSHLSDVLFRATIEILSRNDEARIVLLPRNEEQGHEIRKMWPALFASRKIQIPEHVVDGLNLIWHSDLVISGGGTMNREAAALGVPVYSIFRGKIGAVDEYLAREGRLIILEKPDDVEQKVRLVRRNTGARPISHRPALASIVGSIDMVAQSLDDKRVLQART